VAARQFQIPGGGYINEEEGGREYQLPGVGYFNDETVAEAPTGVFDIFGSGIIAGVT